MAVKAVRAKDPKLNGYREFERALCDGHVETAKAIVKRAGGMNEGFERVAVEVHSYYIERSDRYAESARLLKREFIPNYAAALRKKTPKGAAPKGGNPRMIPLRF